jgi:amino acid adenylation domain-containing protein
MSEFEVDCSTLVELLRGRASKTPGRVAFTYLEDGESLESTLTYGELDALARTVAVSLQRSGALSRGQRQPSVLLLYPPGLEYIAAFFGCLYAGMIAVPAYPPRQSRASGRLQSIFDDARPCAILAPAGLRAELQSKALSGLAFGEVFWRSVEELDIKDGEQWRPISLSENTLAFLQYTSGSTGAPKGVMLTHANILHNQRMIKAGFGHDENTVFVGWLPLYHDMGLIGNVFQPLYLGIPCTLLSPLHFLQRPVRWLRAIAKYGATTSGAPNFAYDLCVRKIAPADLVGIDLRTWAVAFNGAEPIRAATLEAFSDAFRPFGFRAEAFYPCYGLAEASLLVTGGDRHAHPVSLPVDEVALESNRALVAEGGAPAVRLVSSGRSLLDQEVAVVRPESGERCEPREVGEIWVTGPSVACGYYQQPAETERTFRAKILGDQLDRPFLRTGDLGFLDGTDLFVTGRLVDLIIVRGRNYYPHDLELTAERSHPMLIPGGGAAFTVDLERETRLVIVHEVHRHCRGTELERAVTAIRQSIAEEHELLVFSVELLRPGSLPKTSSGKVQRRQCRALFLAGSNNVVMRHAVDGGEAAEASADEGKRLDSLDSQGLLALEPSSRLAALSEDLRFPVSRLLSVPARSIRPDEPLVRYGLDSLMGVSLAHLLEGRFGVAFPASFAIGSCSLEDVARAISLQLESSERSSGLVIPEEAVPEPTQGELALCFLHELNPTSRAYNLSRVLEFECTLEAEALRRACRSVLVAHPVLRSTFPSDGKLVVLDVADSAFVEVDASRYGDGELRARLAQEAQRLFDLNRGPLCRFVLFRRSSGSDLLLVSAHHIVVDLWSLMIVFEDLGKFYERERHGLSAPMPQVDTVVFERAGTEKAFLASARAQQAWLCLRDAFGGELAGTQLNSDRPRGVMTSTRGDTLRVHWDGAWLTQLEQVARRNETTSYVVILAAFVGLLSRLTGRRDVVLGSPVTNRADARFRRSVANFTNQVVIKASVAPGATFEQLIAEVKKSVASALASQPFPFATFAARLKRERRTEHSQLVDIVLAFQSTSPGIDPAIAALALGDGVRARLGILPARVVPLSNEDAPSELTVSLARFADGLHATFHYQTDLFDRTTIDRTATQFERVLIAAANDPTSRVDSWVLSSELEQSDALRVARVESSPSALHVHELFEHCVARSPNHVALVCDGGELTYAQLERRANEIASRLRRLGIGPEALVGVYLDRSLELIPALLGVLKAGAAYLPLDPSYPASRLKFMVQDARVALVLSQTSLADLAGEFGVPLAYVDGAGEEQFVAGASVLLAPNNLAYVIYTSGSTGQPKGVEVTHGALANVILSTAERIAASENDRVVGLTTMAFDIAAVEFFVPLSIGATLLLLDRATASDGVELALRIRSLRATVVQATPTTWRMLLDYGFGASGAPLKIICGGEALPSTLAAELLSTGASVFNAYGPTETAIWSGILAVEQASDAGSSTICIGAPLAGTGLYVLDETLRQTAVGVTGEVFIAGDGLARGYRGHPDWTAERFVPNPFARRPGERLYRTGDLARRRADGRLDFLGRRDRQLKIRGVRIEPGEVETLIARHPAVAAVAVDGKRNVNGELELVAYLVGEESTATTTEILASLRRSLPDSLIPSHFVFVAVLPSTLAGKLDRDALPSPLRSHAPRMSFVAASTAVERAIAAVWCEVLGLERVGVEDNFFELGGHSLLLGRTRLKLEKAFARSLPMRELFQFPTVRKLADYIEGVRHEPRPMEEDAREAGMSRLRARRRQH